MWLAHISDLHVFSSASLRPWHVVGKRATGLLNLATRRRGAHPLEIFEALVDDISAQKPAHTVVTGDITNLSLPSEFERARQTLQRLGGFESLSLVPGNHDIYTWDAQRGRHFERYFSEWLGADPASNRAVTFPVLKSLDSCAIIGLNSAFPTPPIGSWGRISDDQLQGMRSIADRLDRDFPELPRVALFHHNLHPRATRLKDALSGMRQRKSVLTHLAQSRVALALHGHTHTANRFRFPRPDGRFVEIIGCGSSTWANPEHLARYNLYSFEGTELSKVRTRAWNAEARRFEESPESVLTVA